MVAPPTGTVTLLFADIEGSTRLLQALGDRYPDLLTEYRGLLRATFESAGGYLSTAQGDALFAAFPRATDAMTAAVDAQRAVTGRLWPEGTLLRVRMGLHTGQPIRASGDYVGMDVHRAARICAAGYGGQILVSQTTYNLIATDLPEGVGLRDLGEHRLKDLAHPQRLFQVVVADLPAAFPPLKSLDALPQNLPIQLTSFIGREREIAAVKRLLAGARLVTLTGAGGAGKTRLALQIGAEMLEAFRDGVWLVELAAVADPALVLQTVASALGVPEQPGRPLSATLTDHLRPRTLLLLLDNCEHVLPACAHLADSLLRACAGLQILATSRERFGMAGEITHLVPSLSLPDLRSLPSAEDLKGYEAIRLFVERAAVHRAEFALTKSNALAVAQVCHRLDGIPLAIELAAARVNVLTVEQIASRLDDRFRLLTGGSRTSLPRHRTLRAALDWSYDLLSEKERAALRRLSVFAGGYTLDAAEAVCSGKRTKGREVLDLLTRLVDKSLVIAEARGGEARYRLLDMVRQYGRDRLLGAGEAAGVWGRHRDWYLKLAERAEPELRGPGQRRWLDQLDVESDNLRAALEWSRTDDGGAEAGIRLAGALHWFWYVRGYWSEGREWLRGVLARRRDAPASVIPKALHGAALLAWRQGDYDQAALLCRDGVALCRRVKDREHRAWFLTLLGATALHQGDYGQATTLFDEGLAQARARGNKWLVSRALLHLGDIARIQGDDERAAGLYEESLALGRELGDTLRIAHALRNLALVQLRQGDYELATARYRESLAVGRDEGDRWVIEECLAGLAGVACACEDYPRAARLLGAAAALHDTLGLHRLTADQMDYDRHLAGTRARLGERAFQEAWAEGNAMPLEHVIEYVLEPAH